MAEFMIEQWRLAVLRVRLDLSPKAPVIRSELVAYPDGSARQLRSMSHEPRAFGLSETAAAPTALTVPDDLRDTVAEALHADLEGRAALWLRLVPPYGYLGAVPWEEAIVPAAEVPLLRVPDRLPVPTDAGRAWSIAIAASTTALPGCASDHILRLVTALHQRAESSGMTAPEVDLFADAPTHAELRERFDASPPVRLHDPAGAETLASGDAPRTGATWGDWLAEGLGHRSVRALHVVADGHFESGVPLIAIARSPAVGADARSCVFVRGDDVRRLADRIGAVALSFGSPAGNPADAATRMIADEAGQQRPGTTIYSSLPDDPEAQALADVHWFLADPAGEEPVPRHPSQFMYIQPERVESRLEQAWPSLDTPDDRYPAGATSSGDEPPGPRPGPDLLGVGPDPIGEVYGGAAFMPGWVASGGRFIDSEVGDSLRARPSASKGAPTGDAYETGRTEALGELRDLIAEHARKG